MHNGKHYRYSSKQYEQNAENVIIYSEICDQLNSAGITSNLKHSNEFVFIMMDCCGAYLSVFISDDILHIVDGNKLPPVIYRKNILIPGFDIISEIKKTHELYSGRYT